MDKRTAERLVADPEAMDPPLRTCMHIRGGVRPHIIIRQRRIGIGEPTARTIVCERCADSIAVAIMAAVAGEP